MTTSPQRRNRIRQAHQLRQRGHTLRQIAQHLDVSHSTISEDLALLETDRIQLTLNITHDLLLAHTLNLHDRLQHRLYRDPLESLTRPDGQRITLDPKSGPEQIARLEAVHDRATTNALREFRLAVRELERATDRIKNQSTDYPLEQLAAPDHDRTNLNKPDHDHPQHDRTNLNKPDHDHPQHDRTNLNKPDHDLPQHDRTNPTKPGHDQPQHDRTNPTKPDHDYPQYDRTNPTKSDHNQPPRPDTDPPQTAGTPPVDHPTVQPLTLEQFDAILTARPPQLEALRDLVQHPERFPPELPQQMKSVIADIVAAIPT